MKKIFLDTNFLMDYLVRPDFSPVAAQILREGSKNGHRFVVSFLTVANFAYINRKMPSGLRNQMLRGIMESFEVVDNKPYISVKLWRQMSPIMWMQFSIRQTCQVAV